MNTLHVELAERRYPIHIGPGLLSQPQLLEPLRGRPLFVITDEHVKPLYLERLCASLGSDPARALALAPGETAKTLANVNEVMGLLLRARLPRDGVLVALGGGVIGDLVGFCAAIYQRGIDFVQVPTTLLAQVDSSVGGKTGVNHELGKNMIGAFHQPQLVLADTDTLKTLPRRELLAGLAEVIKYGMLGDLQFLNWIEENLDALLKLDGEALSYAIRRSCEMKAAIVAQDERETVSGGAGPRATLNLGHTFAHAIETYTRYTEWLHGEAVATGLCMAADLSARLGWMAQADAQRCIALIARAGLPVKPPAGLDAAQFRNLMGLDKKNVSGRLRLVLMKPLGQSLVSSNFDQAALDACFTHFTSA
ncbi:3-dehydroquinate synthase [Solimonas aquatica]|uniref:3-dehydroquinate synthase n=1 Tax=Solimonas aquatica TaxID=489703 RepID=A0A1H9KUL6_9GAMM|nr:3-dehydroquinate synthase [Solimonas aquatica]SER02738.1 3-dehydroquinate synthase [Solimonas aquatica]